MTTDKRVTWVENNQLEMAPDQSGPAISLPPEPMILRSSAPAGISRLNARRTVCEENVQPIDHTKNKPWRKAALGYQNIDTTDDNGIRQIEALEEMVWSAFKGRPPEGYRVSFLDGNPANCRLDNLVLLSPEEAKALDASNVVPFAPSVLRGQPRVLTLLDDSHVDPTFVADGYAVLFRGIFGCARGESNWRFDFGLDLVERRRGEAAPNGVGPSGEAGASTGEARYSQSRFGLSVEAAVVVGPLRAALLDPSTRHHLLKGLKALHKLIIGELRKAVLSPDALFKPRFAEWMAQQLRSPEALLESAYRECRRRKDDPAIAHRLQMSKSGDTTPAN